MSVGRQFPSSSFLHTESNRTPVLQVIETKKARHEALVMSKLSHPHVVKFHDIQVSF